MSERSSNLTLPSGKAVGFFSKGDRDFLAGLAGGGGGDGSAEFDAYLAAVTTATGTMTPLSSGVISNFLDELTAKSYNRKILYILPFGGSDIKAALVPCRDFITNGAAVVTNNGYVDGDFSEAVGITGDGSSYADLNFHPSQVGYWQGIGAFVSGALDANGTVVGSFNSGASVRWTLALRAVGHFSTFGANAGAVSAVTTGAGHFYGQRLRGNAATERRMYLNGVSNAVDTDSETTRPPDSNDYWLGASNYNGSANTINTSVHVMEFVYFTDGSLTADEALDFHNLVKDSVMTPLGRV